MCCSVLLCVVVCRGVCCSDLQCVAVRCEVCVAVCHIVLQSVLQ